MDKNKVKFNIKNAHYALLSRAAETGAISYGTPKAVPGTSSLSLDPEGEQVVFWADGVKYYVSDENQGYNADWVLARILDQMRKDILKEIQDSDGVMYEVQDNGEPVEFALGFQIDGDKYNTRFWFYHVTASRPGMEANTTEGSRTPQTDTLNLTMDGAQVKTGDERYYVRAKLTSDDSPTKYASWFEEVVLPGTFATSGTESGSSGSGSSGSGT